MKDVLDVRAANEKERQESVADIEALESGIAQLEAKRADYTERLATYEAGRRQYEEGLIAYDVGKAEYNVGLSEYDNSKLDYQEALAALEANTPAYEAGKASYETGLAALTAGRAEYDSGLAAYNAGLAQLNANTPIYEMAKPLVTAGQAAFEAFVDQMTSEYEEGKAQLADYEAKLALYDQISALPIENAAAALFQQGFIPEATPEAATAFLAIMKAQLDANAPAYQAGKEQIAAMEPLIPYLGMSYAEVAATVKFYEDSKAQLDAAAVGLASARQALASGEAQLAAGKALIDEYEAGKAALEAAAPQLTAAEQQLSQAELQLTYAAAQLTNTEAQLDEDLEMIAEFEDGQTRIDSDKQALLENPAVKAMVDEGVDIIAAAMADVDRRSELAREELTGRMLQYLPLLAAATLGVFAAIVALSRGKLKGALILGALALLASIAGNVLGLMRGYSEHPLQMAALLILFTAAALSVLSLIPFAKAPTAE
jgi:chromosome segregation ATPase